MGGVAPLPLQALIVIHPYGVQRQPPPPLFLPPQAPEKQLLQHPAEGSGMENGKGTEEPLHGMQRGHLLRRHLYHCPVALLPLQLIRITQASPLDLAERVQQLQKYVPEPSPSDPTSDPRDL